MVARDKLDVFLALPLQSVESGFRVDQHSLMDLFWKAAGVFLIFGCVDLFRQMRKHKADLRMSKQEIREEMKDVEGNPQMKARIRRLQRDRARRQMMKDVPTATAVVVNPTHFAVAIRYHMDSMAAPLVVAKGKNLPGAAHPPKSDRAPGPDHRESAAGAGALQDRSKSDRRFRRISTARWPKSSPTFSNS